VPEDPDFICPSVRPRSSAPEGRHDHGFSIMVGKRWWPPRNSAKQGIGRVINLEPAPFDTETIVNS